MKGVRSRTIVIVSACAIVFAFMAYSFWPRAISVDLDEVSRGEMIVTVSEEAKTRVHDAYVISAPVTGRLLRVDVEPGDAVINGQTAIARLAPARPSVLDVRTEEQAKSAVEAAQAALSLSKAEKRRAEADLDYANAEVVRTRTLRETGTVSQAALDQAERLYRVAAAALETATAAVAMRDADLENARIMLMSPSEANRADLPSQEAIAILAPISGKVLRVIQESETIVAAGAPIVEIGDPTGDLEIVVELLSTDAVKISPGDRVIINKWGGDESLEGVVDRVEPWGFTKFSALGVEEQRVNAVIQFVGDPSVRKRLGHGFRTEVEIVTWENLNALKIPASAIFRSGDEWAAFRVVKGRARLAILELGAKNGTHAEVLNGVSEGEPIILYPGNRVTDGTRVKQRSVE